MSDSTATPVLFIHGLWVHADSWQKWISLYREAGYDPIAPGWPGAGADVAQTRAAADAMNNQGAEEITAHYSKIISQLPSAPIVIGHSFGGVIAQKLLASGQAAAAIAIDPGQIKGVWGIPLAQVRSGFPALKNPANRHRMVTLTAEQFRYGFGNALTEQESQDLYERFIVPGAGKVPFEVGYSNFHRNAPAAVDTTRNDRGPLLFVAGGEDHAAPESVVRGAYKLYAKSAAITDFHAFPDRGHSLVFDSGWRDIADYTLNWLSARGLSSVTAPELAGAQA
jgi:non-heme chloroperoxidase